MPEVRWIMASYSSSNVGRDAAPEPEATTTTGALLGTKDGFLGRRFRLQGGVYGSTHLNEVFFPAVSFISRPLYSPYTPLCAAFFRSA